MKKSRKNISKLFLFVCLGLTLTTIVFAGARISGDVPSPPGTPKIVDVRADRCELEYLPPVYNGGSMVLNYIIECRNKGDYKWKVIGTSQSTRFVAFGMIEGNEVEFRVRAVNKFGISDPSKSSGFILIKNKL